MSYNIDTCKTKEIIDFKINVQDLYASPRTDWHPSQPEIIDMATMKVKVEGGSEGFKLTGTLDPVNQTIEVDSFENYGEGSGSFENMVLKQVYENSTGMLIVKRVWEGGDSIDKLSVIDGIVTETSIEL